MDTGIIFIITARNEIGARLYFTDVCHSVNRGVWDKLPPPRDQTPWDQTPLGPDPPGPDPPGTKYGTKYPTPWD